MPLPTEYVHHASEFCLFGPTDPKTTCQPHLRSLYSQIAVFNSPFSNSRSVAELVLGQVIALARQVGDRNTEMHNGIYNRSTDQCFEVRGRTLGIIGYGHIGSQLSVLAEAVGMKVVYFDVLHIMNLGTSQSLLRLEDLLQTADFVTLHVPETPETKNMIGAKEIALMKVG